MDGDPGSDGRDGVPGSDGMDGDQGADGRDGVPGSRGKPCPPKDFIQNNQLCDRLVPLSLLMNTRGMIMSLIRSNR